MQKCGPQTRVEAESLGWNQEVAEDESRHAALVASMDQQIRDLARQNTITQAMSINRFFEPGTKGRCMMLTRLSLDDIVTAYSTQERAYKTDEEDVSQRRILTKEAIQALQMLRLHEEQQDDGDSGLISRLGRHERVVRQRAEQGLKQSTISMIATLHRILWLPRTFLYVPISWL